MIARNVPRGMRVVLLGRALRPGINTRLSWLAAAAALALTAGCVHDDNTSASSSGATRTASTTDTNDHNDDLPALRLPARRQRRQPLHRAQRRRAQATTPFPGTYTDAQLRSFVTASAEIDPLNRQLATATGEQRTAIVGRDSRQFGAQCHR